LQRRRHDIILLAIMACHSGGSSSCRIDFLRQRHAVPVNARDSARDTLQVETPDRSLLARHNWVYCVNRPTLKAVIRDKVAKAVRSSF